MTADIDSASAMARGVPIMSHTMSAPTPPVRHFGEGAQPAQLVYRFPLVPRGTHSVGCPPRQKPHARTPSTPNATLSAVMTDASATVEKAIRPIGQEELTGLLEYGHVTEHG